MAVLSVAPVSEEERQIEGYHKALHSLFKGAEDVIVAQAVASFMGCMLSHTEEWRRIIPGYMEQMLDYASVAMAAHRQAENITQPDLTDNQGATHGSEEKDS